ncbi:MAG: hypothetical protein KAH10_08600 [Flavobacteriales bacterium]|nr:hypothetical protein [Flavobacteriales bacterium]
MKKIIAIFIIIFSITSIGYAQSQSTIKLLNIMVQNELPNTYVEGGDGVLNLTISVIDMSDAISMSPELLSDLIKDDPMDFGDIFLSEFTRTISGDLYYIGVRRVRAYFKLVNGERIYGSSEYIDKP